MNNQVSVFKDVGQEIEKIPVPISYEIIHLFSEGLYKSPHKAIEELVTNGYDANAKRVHILLPEPEGDTSNVAQPLWVIDDGQGMDEKGFHQLWRIAESEKTGLPTENGRQVIGQFGIGKLASYVLAWNLTHISHVNGRFLFTKMNFHDVTDWRLSQSAPFAVSLCEVDEDDARQHLSAIEGRDPVAWEMMFGTKRKESSWTVAILSDFKALYERLQTGTLRWVLSTGLPLHADFQIWLNGSKLSSSKENLTPFKTVNIDKIMPGIGRIKGKASIYEKTLTGGKSAQIARSNGFFVSVRKRVINLEDELFGLEAQNHSAWSRFVLEIDADGLREHLLSSREGVRDSDAIRAFREELRDAFNECRTAYENKFGQKHLDILQLLEDKPSSWIYDPILISVRNTADTGTESFYVGPPRGIQDGEHSEWMANFEDEVREKPFQRMLFEGFGQNAPVLRYDPDSRELVVNADHPFINKISDDGRRRRFANLFASSESLLEGQLQDHGINRAVIASLLDDRDRALRLLAGDDVPTAQEVIRRLKNATTDSTALERATGVVFQLLGFSYERKGGNASGPDGVLDARLGRHEDTSADYKLVYDAKQTNHPSVPADKINLGGLEGFRKSWGADFAFFIAGAYQAEAAEDGKLNNQFANTSDFRRLALLKVRHLEKLVRLHYKYGVTLSELRRLFENAHTVPQVDNWLSDFEKELEKQGEISIQTLLQGLEKEKIDIKARPNIVAVRTKDDRLLPFTPEHITARLKAVESIVGSRWIQVDETSSDVTMHQTADEILKELERNLVDLYSRFPDDWDVRIE